MLARLDRLARLNNVLGSRLGSRLGKLGRYSTIIIK